MMIQTPTVKAHSITSCFYFYRNILWRKLGIGAFYRRSNDLPAGRQECFVPLYSVPQSFIPKVSITKRSHGTHLLYGNKFSTHNLSLGDNWIKFISSINWTSSL